MSVDVVLINGDIFSVNEDDRVIRGEAIAIKDGAIVKIGGNEEISLHIDEQTEIIDCGGNTILPGMCDAHCHPGMACESEAACDLCGIYIKYDMSERDMIEQYVERLATYEQEHKDDAIIRGFGWQLPNFEKLYPTSRDLDKISTTVPIVLESFCRRALWVNSRAIEIAGVNAETPDVEGGKIFREEDGVPTGLFVDKPATDLIRKGIPSYELSVDECKSLLEWYQHDCASRYGVTMLQDCLHSDNIRQAYKELAEEGRLHLRARGVYSLEPDKYRDQLKDYIGRRGTDDARDDFKVNTVKLFLEGPFVLNEPYEEKFIKKNGLPDNYNESLFWTDEDFVEAVAEAMKHGMNVHVHAHGDGAVSQAVRCLVKAQNLVEKQPRNVIAHVMLTSNNDAKAMGENHIIANCEPRWMVYDSEISEMAEYMGINRAESAYPFRKFIDNCVVVSFGSDNPMQPPPDTMQGLQGAMTRQVYPGSQDYVQYKGKTLGSEKPATIEEAIKAATINGAYQLYLEDIAGSIEVGKSADLAVLDSNLMQIPVDRISEVKVNKTIFKGKVVYEKEQRSRNESQSNYKE